MPDLRQARLSDHGTLVECVQRWWGDSRTPEQARELSLLLPRLFLQFFAGTSLVLEDDEGIRAFLIGFHAADNDEEAYIHFVGVDPRLRGQGVARHLYTAFFQQAAEAGRREVRAITSPGTPDPSPSTAPWDSRSRKATGSWTVCPCTATTTGPGRTGCASAARPAGNRRSHWRPGLTRKGRPALGSTPYNVVCVGPACQASRTTARDIPSTF